MRPPRWVAVQVCPPTLRAVEHKSLIFIATTTPHTTWQFCPSIGASDLFICLFGITTLFHIYQGIRTRKWYTLAVIMGGLWETGAFVGRTLSIQKPASEGLYTVWFVLILVAPLWINGKNVPLSVSVKEISELTVRFSH